MGVEFRIEEPTEATKETHPHALLHWRTTRWACAAMPSLHIDTSSWAGYGKEHVHNVLTAKGTASLLEFDVDFWDRLSPHATQSIVASVGMTYFYTTLPELFKAVVARDDYDRSVLSCASFGSCCEPLPRSDVATLEEMRQMLLAAHDDSNFTDDSEEEDEA